MKKIIPLIIAAIMLIACNNTPKTGAASNTASDTINRQGYTQTGDSDEYIHYENPEENNPEEPDITFPTTGNKASDFLPKLNIYDIQYEAEGDLNNDGLADIAVVLVHKNLKTAVRPMLILLQNKDKSYWLDKVSNTAMPIEYTESDYKIYDTESLGIENGDLLLNPMEPDRAAIFSVRFVILVMIYC
ncbi:hypothetical protein [Niabella ginsengisoli]|uniref:VCBS repeat-containing protein n=1 Tax=Niabella ginsengisoli TaxID=522298 RepID=A0ABS9SGI4_9BACT|nr:hypothetical protein [Niabella ginsengisoli]MCH5597476.1 hypothetical protein [Niabella ginsengisoli]